MKKTALKVTLYMAMSADGFIAKSDHETPWSEAELESYTAKVQEFGNLIVGKTTYDLMIEEDAFDELGNPFVVVLTSSKELPLREKTVFVQNIAQALDVLEKNGFAEALIGGGGKTDAAALDSGLLDEIFLDVEPHIFGQGIPLFVSAKKEVALQLIGTKMIGENGVQLHYKVLR